MGAFPLTPLSLLSQLRDSEAHAPWQISWKRFVELYYQPLKLSVLSCYRHHTSGLEPSKEIIEDILAVVVVDFLRKSLPRYDEGKGRLRSYLRLLVNARVIDRLRQEKPFDQPLSLEATAAADLPAESPAEEDAFHQALLVTLLEDLRQQIPHRQFEIFERVKLKGRSPEVVAEEQGVRRAVIDNTIYKVMNKLRELAQRQDYQEEYYGV